MILHSNKKFSLTQPPNLPFVYGTAGAHSMCMFLIMSKLWSHAEASNWPFLYATDQSWMRMTTDLMMPKHKRCIGTSICESRGTFLVHNAGHFHLRTFNVSLDFLRMSMIVSLFIPVTFKYCLALGLDHF